MAAGYPVKVDYLTGDVLTATNLNDLAGTVNFYDPTAKGDLFPATAADTVSRLAVGANDTVLTADSAAATGMKWAAAAAGGGMTLLNAGGTTLSGATTTITFSPTGYNRLYVIVTGATNSTANGLFRCAVNAATNIYSAVISFADLTTGAATTSLGASYIRSAGNYNPTASNANNMYVIIIDYPAIANFKVARAHFGYQTPTGTRTQEMQSGILVTTAEITSIVLSNSGGNWSAGTAFVYGEK
jgi:hypothetical protein